MDREGWIAIAVRYRSPCIETEPPPVVAARPRAEGTRRAAGPTGLTQPGSQIWMEIV